MPVWVTGSVFACVCVCDCLRLYVRDCLCYVLYVIV